MRSLSEDLHSPNTAGQFGPDVYARWRASSLGDITDMLEHRLIFRTAGEITGQAVLDAGCGDGTLMRLCARFGAMQVAGCDSDERMLRRARAPDVHHTAILDPIAARLDHLPFADASFDLVTCVTVLTFVPDPVSALREIARVLRPGGRLVLGELNRWSVWAVRRRIRAWFGAALWSAARFRSARTWRGLITEAGLQVEEEAGAIFYPPSTRLARLMAPADRVLGQWTTCGAAFCPTAAR